MRKFLVAAAALFAVAAPAHALELNLGVQGGYAWSEADVSIPLYPSNFQEDADGWVAGGFAGLDWDLSNGWTVGVEADINWTGADGSALSDGSNDELYNIEMNWNAAIRGRVAVDVAPNTELYGAAGWDWADVEAFYSDNNGTGPSDDDTVNGWTIAAGVERDYGNWFGRVEYRYTDYNEADFFHAGPSSVDLDSQALMVGAGWKFAL